VQEKQWYFDIFIKKNTQSVGGNLVALFNTVEYTIKLFVLR